MADRKDTGTTTTGQDSGRPAGGMSSQATMSGATSATRGGGERSGQDLRDIAGSAVEGAREMAGQAAEQARGIAGQLASDVREVAENVLDEQKERAAEKVGGVAEALRKTAEQLHDDNELVARYAKQAADQVERFTDTLRERSLGDLVSDLDDFARRQPTLFLVGAVTAGFLVGRFMASSSERQRHEAYRSYEPRETERHGGEGRTRTAGYGAQGARRESWQTRGNA